VLLFGRTSVWVFNAATTEESGSTDMEPDITFSKIGVIIDAPVREK
jgi:hypothetical protein